MKIRVISTGTTEFEPVHEVGAPAIAAALSGESGEDVASTIVDYTNYERSNISHDDYVVVTGDDGTQLWAGWLSGIDVPPPVDRDALAGAGLKVAFRFADIDIRATCECGWTATGDAAADAFGAWWKHRHDKHPGADDDGPDAVGSGDWQQQREADAAYWGSR